MTRESSGLSVSLRPGAWGVFFLLVLFANVLCAANLPRFAYPGAAFVVGAAVAVDSQGNTYITGGVAGGSLAATAGAFQSQNNGGGACIGFVGRVAVVPCRNAFVIKLNPSGAVVFATYLGGTGDSAGVAIAVDSQQNIYVSGTLGSSATFPVTSGAAFPNNSNSSATVGFIANSWVAKLNSTGTQLIYSTIIPAASIASIAIDGAGSVYFTGKWEGPALFPATPGAFQSAPFVPAAPLSFAETIVGKFNPSGSALVYGSYLTGQMGFTTSAAIAVDGTGNAIIAGATDTADFPATSGQFSTALNSNAYLAKFNADGSQLIYASLLGPGGVAAMKTDAGGDLYLTCSGAGSTFAATAPGFGVPPPAVGSFLLHLSADGSTVVSSVYLPFNGSSGDLDVDSLGNSYIAGYTSAELPFAMSLGAFQPVSGGFGSQGAEGVIAKITRDGQVAGVTYLGGSQGALPAMIAAERDGSVVVGGTASLGDFLGLTVSSDPGSTFFFATNIFPAITLENSASYVANTAVPGELVSLQGYGMGLAAGASSLPTTTLAGVQVYFDNFAAPVTYAQAGQINVQVPWEIAGQSSTRVTIYNGAEVGSAVVPVSAAMPGVFFINNSDGSRNSPSNPARAGDYVAVYGTGGGAMNPGGVTGASWPLIALSQLSQNVSVAVGSETAGIIYAGSAPTLDSGFFQIDVLLPSDLTPGAEFLSITVGGVLGAAGTISIR